MNMQAMLKQAQSLQKDMVAAKAKVDAMEFSAESSLVKITMKGTRVVTKVEIKNDGNFDGSDLEMLEDMIMVAINDVNQKVDKAIEDNVGKYTKGLPGMF